MSESNGTFHLGSGTLSFTLDGGQEFQLDPIEALVEIQRIRAGCAGKEDYSHIREFRDWLKTTTQVELSLAQADKVWEVIETEHLRGKVEVEQMQRSLIATISTPSPSPPEND